MAKNPFPNYGADYLPDDDGPVFDSNTVYDQGEIPGKKPKIPKTLPTVVRASQLIPPGIIDNEKAPTLLEPEKQMTVHRSAQLDETRVEKAERLQNEIVFDLSQAGERYASAARKAITVRDEELWRELNLSSLSEFIEHVANVSRSKFYNDMREIETKDILRAALPEMSEQVESLSLNASIELAKSPETAVQVFAEIVESGEQPTQAKIRKRREKKAKAVIVIEKTCPHCGGVLP